MSVSVCCCTLYLSACEPTLVYLMYAKRCTIMVVHVCHETVMVCVQHVFVLHCCCCCTFVSHLSALSQVVCHHRCKLCSVLFSCGSSAHWLFACRLPTKTSFSKLTAKKPSWKNYWIRNHLDFVALDSNVD